MSQEKLNGLNATEVFFDEAKEEDRAIYVAAFQSGDGVEYVEITKDEIEKVGKLLGIDDLEECIDFGDSFEIKRITEEENLKARLNGYIEEGFYELPMQIRAGLDDNSFSDSELKILSSKFPKEFQLAIKYKNTEEMEEKEDFS